jgi:hypothetical protein
LTSLDVSSNGLGGVSSNKEGWKIDRHGDYISPEGKDHHKNKPAGVEFKPFGIIALADAIPGMGAMTSLNLASNFLGGEGAKVIAACLPKCT